MRLQKKIPIFLLLFFLVFPKQLRALTSIQWTRLLAFEDRIFLQLDNDLNDASYKIEAWIKLTGVSMTEISIALTPMTYGAVDTLQLGINLPHNYSYTYHGETNTLNASGNPSTWIWPYDNQEHFEGCGKSTLINTNSVNEECEGYATVYTFYFSPGISYTGEEQILSWFNLKNVSDPDGCGIKAQTDCMSTSFCKWIDSACHQIISDETNTAGLFRKAILPPDASIPQEKSDFIGQLMPSNRNQIFSGKSLSLCTRENWDKDCSKSFASYIISGSFSPSGNKKINLGNSDWTRTKMRTLQYDTSSSKFIRSTNNPNTRSGQSSATGSYEHNKNIGGINALLNHFREPNHRSTNEKRKRCHFLDIVNCGEDLSCPDTQVAHSDYSAIGSITGTHGASVTVNCKEGWRAGGDSFTMNCTNSGWDNTPTCSPNSCTPISINNSRDFSPPATLTGTTGQNTNVICANGFSGGGNYTCQEDGNFNGNPCIANQVDNSCPTITIPNSDNGGNASISGDNGDSVTLNCNLGYRANGNSFTINCANNQWDSTPTCGVDSCTPISIPNSSLYHPPNKLSGTTGQTFNVACAAGFTGGGGYLCEANGTFTGPSCDPVESDGPKIISYNIADGKTNVSTGQSIRINFDEQVQKGAGFIRIRRLSDNSLFEEYNIASSTRVVRPIWGASSFQINPTSNFEVLTTYYLEFDPGVVVDNNNNGMVGISNTSTLAPDNKAKFSFTTTGANCVIDKIEFAKGNVGGSTGTFNLNHGRGKNVSCQSMTINEYPVHHTFNRAPVTQRVSCNNGDYNTVVCTPKIRVTSSSFGGIIAGGYPTQNRDYILNPAASSISLTFSDPYQIQETGNLSFQRRSNSNYNAGVDKYDTVDNSDLEVIDSTNLRINMRTTLTPFRYYKLIIPTNKFKMADITETDVFNDGHYVHFKTGPIDLPGPPSVVSYSPANGSVDVAESSNIVINFNESVILGTGKIVLRESPGGAVIEEFQDGDGKITISNNDKTQVTLNPANDFKGLIDIYIEFKENAIKDYSDNYMVTIPNTSLLANNNPAQYLFATKALNCVIPKIQYASGSYGGDGTFNLNHGATTGTIGCQSQSFTAYPNFMTVFRFSDPPTITCNNGTFNTVTCATRVHPLTSSFGAIFTNNRLNENRDYLLDPNATNFTITFSDPIEVSNQTHNGFKFWRLTTSAHNSPVDKTIDLDQSNVTLINDTTIQVSLSEPLTHSRYYIFKIPANRFKMKNITSREIYNQEVYVQFKTDILNLPGPPTITSYNPKNNSINVSTTTPIVVYFNEFISLGTGKIILRNSNGDGIVEEFVPGDGKAVATENYVTLTPSSELPGLANLYLELQTNAVKDSDNEELVGISSTAAISDGDVRQFEFTTEARDCVHPPIQYATQGYDTKSKVIQHGANYSVFCQDPPAVNTHPTFYQQKRGLYPGNTTCTNGSFNRTISCDLKPYPISTTTNGPITTTNKFNGNREYTVDPVMSNWNLDITYDFPIEINGLRNHVYLRFNRRASDAYNSGLSHLGSFNVRNDQLSIVNGNTLRISGVQNLIPLSYYYLEIPTDKVKRAGHDLAHMFGPVKTYIHFKTGTINVKGAPQIVSYSPVDGTTEVVQTGSTITITFNESIKWGSGNILIRNSSNGSVFETFSNGDGKSLIDQTNNTLTLTPSGQYGGLVDYYLEFQTDSITDYSDTSIQAIKSTSSLDNGNSAKYSFQTKGSICVIPKIENSSTPGVKGTSGTFNLNHGQSKTINCASFANPKSHPIYYSNHRFPAATNTVTCNNGTFNTVECFPNPMPISASFEIPFSQSGNFTSAPWGIIPSSTKEITITWNHPVEIATTTELDIKLNRKDHLNRTGNWAVGNFPIGLSNIKFSNDNRTMHIPFPYPLVDNNLYTIRFAKNSIRAINFLPNDIRNTHNAVSAHISTEVVANKINFANNSTPINSGKCLPTQTENSNKSASQSITGEIGDLVSVVCNEGYVGGGDWLCDMSGYFMGQGCSKTEWLVQLHGSNFTDTNGSSIDFTHDDRANSFLIDSLENIYAFGSRNNIDHDGLILKLNSDGEVIWEKVLTSVDNTIVENLGDDIIQASAIDSIGNIYFTINTSSNFAAGVSQETPNTDCAIGKMNSDGIIQWVTQLHDESNTNAVIGDSSAEDKCSSITISGLGDEATIYVAGHTYGQLDPTSSVAGNHHDGFVASLMSIGAVNWVRHIPDENHAATTCNSITSDGEGNIYCGGTTNQKSFVTKFSSSGDVLANYTSSHASEINGLAINTNDDVIATGSTPDEIEGLNAGGIDGYILKLDSSLTVGWIQQIGNNDVGGAASGDERCLDVKITSSGEVMLLCSTTGPLADTNVNGHRQPVIIKVDTNGSVIWAKQYGDSMSAASLVNDIESGNIISLTKGSIAIGSNGSLYIGSNIESADLGFSDNLGLPKAAGSDSDPWFMKINEETGELRP